MSLWGHSNENYFLADVARRGKLVKCENSRGLHREHWEARAGWVSECGATLWTRNSAMMITIWPYLYCTWAGVCTMYFLPPPISDSFHGDLRTQHLFLRRGEERLISDEMMMSCIIQRVHSSTQAEYFMSFRWQDVSDGGETCLMFPSWCQSRGTSALLTFSIFPLSESLSSLWPGPGCWPVSDVDVIVVILVVAWLWPSSAHTLGSACSPQCPGVRPSSSSSFPSLPSARPSPALHTSRL